MKIHTIRGLNLNSLYGPWSVDLEGAFGDSGLFLIHGPTGSGKSTLMDAVSLALFGTTPRLIGIKSGKAVAEQIMSRGTAECLAEVEFSKSEPTSQAARSRYRGSWKAQRAHRNSEGNISRLEHTLERLAPDGSWTVLNEHTSTKASKQLFAEVLEGFRVEEFQRSMLLAQGQFDRLLHASPSERAPILELLTHTQQYKEVGERAAQLGAAWRRRLDRLKPMEASPPLNEEDLERLERRTDRSLARKKRLAQEQARHAGERQWRLDRQHLDRDVETAESRVEATGAEWAAAAPNFERLERYEEAEELLQVLDGVQQAEADRGKSAGALGALLGPKNAALARRSVEEAARNEILSKLSLARRVAEEFGSLVNVYEGAYAVRESASTQVRDQLAMVLSLRAQMEDLRKTKDEQDERHLSAWSRIREERDALRPSVREVLGEKLMDLLERLPSDPEDAPPDETFARGIEASLTHIEFYERAAVDLRSRRQRMDELQRDTLKQAQWAEQSGWELSQRSTEAADMRIRLSAQEEAERQARERFLPLQRLHRLAEEGGALISGEPCPVCGSLDHPRPQLTDALDEEYERARGEAEREIAATQAARDELTRLTTAVALLEQTNGRVSRDLANAIEELESARTVWQLLATAKGISPETDLESLEKRVEGVKEARYRLDRVRGAVQVAREVRKEVELSNRTSDEQEKEWHERQAKVKEKEEELSVAELRVRQAEEQLLKRWRTPKPGEPDFRDRLTEEKLLDDPDLVLELTRDCVRGLEKEEREAQANLELAQTVLAELALKEATHATRLGDAETVLLSQSPVLAQGLAALGLPDRESLEGRRLDPKEAASLQESRVRLQIARAEAEMRLTTARTSLKSHEDRRGEGPRELSDEGLEEKIEKLAYRVQCAETVWVKRSSRLEMAKRDRNEWRKKQQRYDEARKEAEPWLRLRDLIGVNNGDNFREFAQAQNLDLLLERANDRLKELNPRYRLQTIRDAVTGMPTLEFGVEDRWRADQPRSLKTLSGGESFLVSLALALGLSQLRTRTMPVETLLLDEGFGTLDADTLSTALSALERLQQDQRQVGMISHVGGLEERVDKRIRVEPLGQGRSRVHVETGPLVPGG